MSRVKHVAAAGVKTVANLLRTAIKPLGNTMYVWGGGWNEEDNGAGEEARCIGVSLRWKEFAEKQDTGYDFKDTRYQIHDGLDCSGYVGWVIYNVFETEDGEAGYVMPASYMAWEFAGMGWGKYIPAELVKDWAPGDIMSMKGHVWISLGMCEDGSVVLLHASPPGVILCGTELPVCAPDPEEERGQAAGGRQEALPHGGRQAVQQEAGCFQETQPAKSSVSQAVQLAQRYMSRFYPQWYERYPDCSRDVSYLKNSSQMRWNRRTLSDAECLTGKSAEEVLAWLFESGAEF